MSAFVYIDTKLGRTNLRRQIWDILLALRPQWCRHELRQEEFTTHYTTAVMCFHQEADKNRSDALVVRICGIEGHETIDRERELLLIQIAHAAGCFPPIVATFQNGLVYKYAPGRVANYHDLTSPKVIRSVSQMLYRLHSVDIDSVKLYDRKGNLTSFTETPKTLDYFASYIQAIPSAPQNDQLVDIFNKCRSILSDDFLKRDYEYMKRIIEAVELPTSIVHGDFHPKNIVIDYDGGRVAFVDYELSGVYYEISDFAFLFHSKAGYSRMGCTSPREPDLTEGMCQLYLREYLRAARDFSAPSKAKSTAHEDELEIDDEEVELLYLQSCIVRLVNQFLFLILSLANINLQVRGGLKILDFLPERINKYMEEKRELPALVERCIKLRAKMATNVGK